MPQWWLQSSIYNRGHSEATLTKFCAIITPSLVDTLDSFTVCIYVKYLYTVDIPSTTGITVTRLVNIGKEWPPQTQWLKSRQNWSTADIHAHCKYIDYQKYFLWCNDFPCTSSALWAFNYCPNYMQWINGISSCIFRNILLYHTDCSSYT